MDGSEDRTRVGAIDRVPRKLLHQRLDLRLWNPSVKIELTFAPFRKIPHSARSHRMGMAKPQNDTKARWNE